MKKVSFIGCYDKIDIILYIAKILVELDKRVLVIDTTVNQKAKYIVPVIKPNKSYVTEFEQIDVAVGFKSFDALKDYLGLTKFAEIPYDYILLDIDSYESILSFNITDEERKYFVTGFDLYTLKKGLEILSGITEIMHLTKVIFSQSINKEDNEYLDYLSLGYKIVWNNEIVYFPSEYGDASVIAENQRVAKIKFKKLSNQYKEGLVFIAEQIIDKSENWKLRKVFKQLERGS